VGRASIAAALSALLTLSCASTPEGSGGEGPASWDLAAAGTAPPATAAGGSKPASPAASAVPEPAEGSASVTEGPAVQRLRPSVKRGTGVFVNVPPPSAALDQEAREGIYTLNFEKADLREVVETVLGELLKQNYTIADGVAGTVTMRSHRPLAEEDLLPALEGLLQANGAALVKTAAGYQVVPLAKAGSISAPRAVGTPTALRAGYGVQVVPLRYVGAAEVKKLLESMVPEGASVVADETRNLLILRGPQRAVGSLLELVEVLDVDWLQGMSMGVYPLDYADARLVVEQLSEVLGGKDGAGLKGVVRLMPIERLNAVLVISKQPKYLDDLSRLVAQFDQGYATPSGSRRLFVYSLRNGKSKYIAEILSEIFIGKPEGESAMSGEVASDAMLTRRALTPPAAPPAGEGGAPPAAPADALGGAVVADLAPAGATEAPVNIIADPDNNAVLVMASPRDYRTIEAALRRLDVRPRQVLIETIIAEVTLTDNLEYGVQWFLNGSLGQYSSITALGAGLVDGAVTIPPIATGVGRFSYSLGTEDGVKFLFDLLSKETTVRFISAPQILVVDNQTANIKVGDQVPITTGASQNVAGDVIVTQTEYRDTGTLLKVTPRINAGGLVTLEVSQEVSAVGSVPEDGGNPVISQRTVESVVTVQSGEAIALGGLIRDDATKDRTGIPVLKDLPVLGPLFGRTIDRTTRTELIVTITPTVIEDQQMAREATVELKQRLAKATEALSAVSRPPAAPRPPVRPN
jgi:general secretion pathway protein D